MGYKAESITVQMNVGQRANALNHISALRTMMYGDCSHELKRFIAYMRNKRDHQAEQNGRVLNAIFFLANISKERHGVDFSELTNDDVMALISEMNHILALVSLFSKILTLPN